MWVWTFIFAVPYLVLLVVHLLPEFGPWRLEFSDNHLVIATPAFALSLLLGGYDIRNHIFNVWAFEFLWRIKGTWSVKPPALIYRHVINHTLRDGFRKDLRWESE